jgi:arylsulfatase A-like enzyme
MGPRAHSIPSLIGRATLIAVGGAGCSPSPPASVDAPDVLVVVWDTVRADRLSAYGHEAPTTPWLEQFQRDGVTWECLAPGSNTIATHGSLFTGLPPTEHGATFRNKHLDEEHETLAELLNEQGYATWLWGSNPSLSSLTGFSQGFEVEAHPWDEAYREQATSLLASKLERGDSGTGFRARSEAGELAGFDLAPTGALAAPSLGAWVAERRELEPSRPVFAFVNLMEAHYPLLPSLRHRLQVMSPERARESYSLGRSWNRMWRHVAGVEPYTVDQLELFRATYDAAIAELDAHTEQLVGDFAEALGPERWARAVVVVTSDHGEHLGEPVDGWSMLDHRYTLAEPLLRVPLVVRAPGRLDGIAPGADGLRRGTGAAVQDLFPTLLHWAGHPRAASVGAGFVRRLDAPAPADRARLAEYQGDFGPPVEEAVVDRELWRSTGLGPPRRSLRIGDEVLERRGLARGEWVGRAIGVPPSDFGPARGGWVAEAASMAPAAEAAGALRAELDRVEQALVAHPNLDITEPRLTAEQLQMLERLGYGDG